MTYSAAVAPGVLWFYSASEFVCTPDILTSKRAIADVGKGLVKERSSGENML